MAKWTCECGGRMDCFGTGHNGTATVRRYRCIGCGNKITTNEVFSHQTGDWIRPGNAKYHAISRGGKRIATHLAVAEAALGKPLPAGAIVHHVDCNSRNNDKTNLVICPNQAYHSLLHVRTEALEACGHADWRKCVYCKEWGPPEAMSYRNSNRHVKLAYHKKCHSDYQTRKGYGRQAAA